MEFLEKIIKRILYFCQYIFDMKWTDCILNKNYV